MKRIALVVLVTTLFAVPVVARAANLPQTASPGITGDLDTMAGMLTDIGRLLGQKPITPDQRRQIMGLLGELGGVMQEMGAGGEAEGWRVGKERHRIHEIKTRLNELQRQLGNDGAKRQKAYRLKFTARQWKPALSPPQGKVGLIG